jgi:hypothetical protein
MCGLFFLFHPRHTIRHLLHESEIQVYSEINTEKRVWIDKLAALREWSTGMAPRAAVYTCGLTSRAAKRLKNALYEVESKPCCYMKTASFLPNQAPSK